MPLISEEYRRLNEELHRKVADYGVNGSKYVEYVTGLAKALGTEDILDYGCGKSTLSMHFPFAFKQYDPAIPRFSDLPEAADLVVCTDVLEHIEPELIGEVLEHLHSLTKKALFAVISVQPAKKFLSDGRNAHLIVEPPRWWLNALWDKFEIVKFNLGEKHIMVTCVPHKKAEGCAS